MIDCKTFLARYSEYRDGELAWAEREEMDAHADDCPACDRYDRVVHHGIDVFRTLPEIEVSDDFGERLRWRLHQADYEMSLERHRPAPWQALGTLAVAATVAFAAWVPLMHPRPFVGRLPAVVAAAPSRAAALRQMVSARLHEEATGLTSRLAQIGVTVNEAPYHDVVFRSPGPLVGQVAVYTPPANEPR